MDINVNIKILLFLFFNFFLNWLLVILNYGQIFLELECQGINFLELDKSMNNKTILCSFTLKKFAQAMKEQ